MSIAELTLDGKPILFKLGKGRIKRISDSILIFPKAEKEEAGMAQVNPMWDFFLSFRINETRR